MILSHTATSSPSRRSYIGKSIPLLQSKEIKLPSSSCPLLKPKSQKMSKDMEPSGPGLRPPNDPEPPLQYKHRGLYESRRFTPGRIFFVFARLITLIIIYSLLVSPSSPTSIYRSLPILKPSTRQLDFAKHHAQTFSLPFPFSQIPGLDEVLIRLGKRSNMSAPNFTLYTLHILFSLMFTHYTLLFRREYFPLTGDGGSLSVSSAVSVIDIVQVLLYTHTSVYNPTWCEGLFRWGVLGVVLGVGGQWWSDWVKHCFKMRTSSSSSMEKDKREGKSKKVLQSGPWSLVRHPNFTGFLLWKTALGCMLGGWAFGGLVFWGMGSNTWERSIPSIEVYMEGRYGEEWSAYRRRVKWRLVRGVY
ncbi:hypothetical protein DL98DRAFT_654360 [Cadophora sp. DSE1049]|nr:hypothetical protein DL98DRAFT_654360 [Cadophora sp. DSE1049]